MAIVARTILVYAMLLLVLRVPGKRTIGNFTAFDLLVALMLGEMVDDIVFAEVPLVHGLLAIGTVSVVHLANTWLTYTSPGSIA